MTDELRLTEAERGLLLDLLRRELEELPTEIHHTARADYRQELRDRRRSVESLVERIQAVSVA